jgi:hypothetical protein
LPVNKEEAPNVIIDLFICGGVTTDNIITSSADGAGNSAAIQSPQVIHLDVLEAAVLERYEATSHPKEPGEYTYLNKSVSMTPT